MQFLRRHRNHVVADILAGITGAVAGAPQAMGFAIVAGISPLYGLYTAVVPTIVGALTTGSVFMTVGPTNAVALVAGSVLLSYADNDPIGHLFTLTLLVGLFQLLFAVLRLDGLMRFVSNAVMTGFVTGAAILIVLGQLFHLVGVDEHGGGNSLLKVWDWANQLPHAQYQTMIVGVLSLVIIYTLHHTRLRGLATLIAMVITSIMVLVFDWQNVPLVQDMSVIASGLPQITLPNIAYIPDLAVAGLAVALLASLQAAGITRSVPQPDGRVASVRRDLMGQGLANMGGSFFQCMPAGGSLSRTAVNVSAGGRTRLSNVIAGLLVAVVLLFLGRYIERIPLAALAAHLVIAAFSLIRFDVLRLVWRVGFSARVAMVVTFLSTQFLSLEYSIYVGVIISLLLYVYSSVRFVELVRLIPLGNGLFREDVVPGVLPSSDPVILSVSGNLYFAAISKLEELLPSPGDADSPVVVLRLRDHHFLGSTGIRSLDNYARLLESHGGKLVLAGVEDDIRLQLVRTGELRRFGSESVFYAGDVIFDSTSHAYDYAKEWLHQKDHSPVNGN